MNQNRNKILVVEDNEKYQRAAKNVLPRAGLQITYASDFAEAVNSLQRETYDGALVDCFFPEKSRSGSRSLGKKALEAMLSADKGEQGIRRTLEELKQYVPVEDPELKPYMRKFASALNSDGQAKKCIFETIKIASSDSVRTGLLNTMKGTPEHHGEYQGLSERELIPNFYDLMEKALEQSETNQPLGILLAEEFKQRKIPFVLVTSTYHHDNLTQKIHEYVGHQGWKLIDCPPNMENGKATPEFWEKAVYTLMNEKIRR